MAIVLAISGKTKIMVREREKILKANRTSQILIGNVVVKKKSRTKMAKKESDRGGMSRNGQVEHAKISVLNREKTTEDGQEREREREFGTEELIDDRCKRNPGEKLSRWNQLLTN